MVYEEAKAKLEREAKEGTYDKYAAAMKSAVLDALIDFTQQDEEFARAVLDGGSLRDSKGKPIKKERRKSA